ncbi:MAG: hypothetical protein ACRD8A_03835 [Candidatus Acidiferrales bacterium]
MKRIVSGLALLSCSLLLGGCMLRATGPCLGYGCPALSGGADSYHAQSIANSPKSTAKNESTHQPGVHVGN